MKSELIFVINVFAIATANYEDKLTKLWSMSDEGQRTAVVNVTTASIVINPSYKQDSQKPQYRNEYARKYAFKPRSIPLNKQEQQVERSIHYANNDNYKSEILFPGNYFPIAEVKRKDLDTKYEQVQGSQYHPKIIPLFRNQQFQRRSMDFDEPIIEKPEGYEEPIAMRRSISYFLGDEDLDDDEDEEIELDVDKDDGSKKVNRRKIKMKKKYARYMLPLLLAYKMKFFSLVPLMIGGLVLLVGATGMAGFFFALFAAVMGLQKGSY